MELRDEVLAKRKLVADTINHHLAMQGHDARVDHRTLKEQGLERKAERRIPAFRLEKMSPAEKAAYIDARNLSRKVKASGP